MQNKNLCYTTIIKSVNYYTMSDSDNFFHPPRRNDVLLILLNGILISGISLVLAWVAGNYIIAGPVCGNSTSGPCAVPFTLGYNIFLIIGALAATTWFVYGRIFRPALVALPPVVMFWSLPDILRSVLELGLPVFGLISVVLITFSYLVFYWLVRINNFFAVLLLWLAIVLGIRFLLVL